MGHLAGFQVHHTQEVGTNILLSPLKLKLLLRMAMILDGDYSFMCAFLGINASPGHKKPYPGNISPPVNQVILKTLLYLSNSYTAK